MAAAPTIYQKKQAARRASADIERLAKTYQTGMFDVTQQQQNAFTGWNAKTKELMAPYEAKVKQYTSVDFPAYQSQLAQYKGTMDAYDQQVAAYRQRLDAFNQSLIDYEANPKEVVSSRHIGGRYDEIIIEGKTYSLTGAQKRYVPAEYDVKKEGAKYTVTKNKALPTFTENPPEAPSAEMPTAPTAPGAPPQLPTFDSAPFQAKREELGTTFNRELGERKSAKQNVVMRRMSRGMLQGA